MPRAEYSNRPIRTRVKFEQQCHFTAAGHTDIGLQVPCTQFAGGLVTTGQHLLASPNGSRLDLSSANRPTFDAINSDERLRTDDLRRATTNRAQRDGHERRFTIDQLLGHTNMVYDVVCHARGVRRIIRR